MVEEAGQVLEAHVLGSLVPSVEHLILIGDPLQLRPNLNNFGMLQCDTHIRRLTLVSQRYRWITRVGASCTDSTCRLWNAWRRLVCQCPESTCSVECAPRYRAL